ncbi:UNVERIFIED_CONTAM: hypothetical protein HDU68_011216, partial [Siphonaria sp. JEL0065]
KVKPNYFYNVSDNYNINLTAYNNVAPVHLTSAFALSYASSFLTVTAALVHVALWYGKDIYRQTMNAFRQVRDEVDAMDKHVKMMEAYPDVPDWMYLAFMAVCIVGGVLVSVATPFGMPWWGIFFNVFLVSLFVVPYGSIYAITGVQMYLNVLTEFVIGLMIPGQTVAVMAFKSWGTNNLIQALNLSGDLKLGQYLHIPPYAMVGAQMWGTFINAVVSTAAAYFMMFNTGWNCPPNGTTNFPIFFQFAGVQTYQVYVIAPFVTCFIGQALIFNRHKEFYQKYLYVMGAAFDASAGINGQHFIHHHLGLEPNTDNVPLDYYCYPGADYKDFNCDYYVAQGINATADCAFCPGVSI